MSKITTIIGFTAPRSEMPALEINGGNDRAAWIDRNMVSTYRRGHWNNASCEQIAAKMGIVDGLKIKFH
jgi:hypothetical protein